MNEIDCKAALSLNNPVFIDVRAPVEFSQDHIPGALNLPVFNDEERALVGTMYRMQGQESAILKGTEIAGSKIGNMVETIGGFKGRDVVIYCFRGGMRSTSLVALLSSLGYHVYKLEGGYKGYRRYVRERIELVTPRPPAFVLHGLAGTGKTAILENLRFGIDLEKMAGHRSSVFGGVGLVPGTQKMFESLLVYRIDMLQNAGFVVLEGESRKIGDIHVPPRILDLIHSSPAILITASLERRIQILLGEYMKKMNPAEVVAIVQALASRIGKKNMECLIDLFENGCMEEFTALLLEKYYDPLYIHSLESMRFIATIENTNSADAAVRVDEVIENYLR